MKNDVIQLSVEDVNGNYVGQWDFATMPKPSELVEGSLNDVGKYYFIYSEEIELDEVLMVEELTEKEFNDFMKTNKYNSYSIDMME